jgi:arylsulfatase A-like enzyme
MHALLDDAENRAWLHGLFFCMAICLLAACSDAEGDKRPRRVVVVVLDSTHAAHLGCYGGVDGLTPALDALAENSRLFSQAVSNTTWTLPSTVSLMTGQLQETHGIVTNQHALDEGAVLLAEQFREAGFLTAAFVQMVYASEIYGLDQGFDEWNRYQLTVGIRPEGMAQAVADWMDEHADDEYFLYVHMRRPHSPYDPNPLFKMHLEEGCPLADGHLDETLAHADSRVKGSLSEVERSHVEHLYRANLATVDNRIRDILRRAQQDDEALLVVTADHGEALGEHGHYGHGYSLDAECIDIPLLVAGVGVVPGIDDEPASTVDIAPTLHELCGLGRPADLDGRSLVSRLQGEVSPRRSVLLSTRYNRSSIPEYGLIKDGFKVVLDREGSLKVFEMSSGEDVTGVQQELAGRVGELLRTRKIRASTLSASEGRTPLEASTEAELRALGYIR